MMKELEEARSQTSGRGSELLETQAALVKAQAEVASLKRTFDGAYSSLGRIAEEGVGRSRTGPRSSQAKPLVSTIPKPQRRPDLTSLLWVRQRSALP